MKTNKLSRAVATSLLISAFTFSPGLIYAKQDKKEDGWKSGERKETLEHRKSVEDKDTWDNEDEHEKREKAKESTLERKNSKMEKRCLKSFGLLIARSHNKERLQELADRVCFWPFGIWKKISTTTPPTTPDTTAPVISNIKAETRVFKAEVRWETSEKAGSVLYYSTTTPLNLSGATRLSRGPGREHRAELTGLAASTTYYALISATDPSGNTATSSEFFFTTENNVPDVIAPIISSVAALVGTTTVSIRWQTNEPSTSKLFFGTTTPLDANASTTPFTENAALVNMHRLDLANLSTSTTYYLIIESKDASGNVRRTGQFQATTLGL